jgi:hypothetical protein
LLNHLLSLSPGRDTRMGEDLLKSHLHNLI